MEAIKWRTALAVLGLGLVLGWNLPNLTNMEKIPWWPSKQKLNLGLDIQGGLHLVMGVDIPGVLAESTKRIIPSIQSDLEKENLAGTKVQILSAAKGEIELQFPATTKKQVQTVMEKYPYFQIITENEEKIQYRYLESHILDYRNKVIQQAIETIRNRIDQFGVAEPSIASQGADRILIQLPGMADAEKAKSLVNTTARLDFMIVENKSPEELQTMIEAAEKAGGYDFKTLKYNEYIARINADLKGKVPENTILYFEKAPNVEKMELGRIPMLLRTDSGLTGDYLSDAYVSFGQFGEPVVALQFNSAGAGIFQKLTGQNKGRLMAIVLDRVVKTAPSLREEIAGGRAQISLGGRNAEQSMNEAKMISMTLRAGALPAALEQLEERRVGPTLGADSIRKAIFASWFGAIAVILFMIFRYRAMGAVSILSLALNIAAVIGLLTILGATLTLPGIAGIALTVGFAVDANVLINERMREELARGMSFTAALKEGYARAMSAILDANITTAATAVVLLFFGTGPVKGFAVTLLVGIVTTMFANVFFSKVIVDLLVFKFGFKKLSI